MCIAVSHNIFPGVIKVRNGQILHIGGFKITEMFLKGVKSDGRIGVLTFNMRIQYIIPHIILHSAAVKYIPHMQVEHIKYLNVKPGWEKLQFPMTFKDAIWRLLDCWQRHV